MCGILGIVTTAGRTPSVDESTAAAIRDRMSHRGPDGHGLWRLENAILAHRRLAIVDPTPAGHQPMVEPGGRSALVYNGELYNDDELRAELVRKGNTFHTRSDAETVFQLLKEHGADAIPMLRGMYALGFFDADRQVLVLARDPLGIKPLYYAVVEVGGGPELVFASELPAILAHPAISVRPDFITVSSYLTTIRTTLGSRTLFAGVQTLEPGEVAAIDLRRPELCVAPRRWWGGRVRPVGIHPPSDEVVREAIIDSISRHLRSDVPLCCLLSGGLDSTIVAAHAARLLSPVPLRTYASGCPDPSPEPTDLSVARGVSSKLGTVHTEAPVVRAHFLRRWPELVHDLGVPLSTPNEVAIDALAARLRTDGNRVALSGEGADELFGGYEAPLQSAVQHLASISGPDLDAWRRLGGEFQLSAAAWIAPDKKQSVLSKEAHRRAEGDAYLRDFYITRFEQVSHEPDDPSPLETHLRFTRSINLTGLLLRLDQATMRHGVEGRTPFADQCIAELAGQLPIERKYQPARRGTEAGEPTIARTKVALRSAMGGDLPSSVLARPKASFPLPFQAWLSDHAGLVLENQFVRSTLSDTALAAVAHSPERFWPVAWPAINLAMWGRRWWG